MDNRDRAIALAEKYKQIEREIYMAPRGRRLHLIQEAAGIAREMFSLGVSLPKLILKRQARKNDHQNQR
jgi:hypothetical protein